MISTSVITLAMLLGMVLVIALVVRPRGASTVDFYLAGQQVGVVTNACAICGDYVSAASFLGVAAAVYVSGLEGVWYATGFAAGFVPVVLFVAAPLRRFGEFSIPDFLARRLGSERVRLTAVGVVQLIILSYLVPQAVGSGITWQLLVGHGLAGLSPYATGVVVSTAVITCLVAFGGMRGTTWTQAVQFLILLAALIWLAAAAVGAGFDYGSAVGELAAEPAAAAETGDPYIQLSRFALIVTLVMGTAGLPHVMNRYFTSPTGTAARMTTVWVLGLAGLFYALAVMLGTAARSLIPGAVGTYPWLRDLTADGVLRVPEYALPVLGRIHGGEPALAFVAAGALIAVMSTIAGLLLASAASWGHDVYERHVNPRASQRQAVRAGRGAVIVVALLSAVLALVFTPEALSSTLPSIVATMVTWAFALAGSALTPVFILAIWWRGTTASGAIAGMMTGAVLAIGLFVVGMLVVDRGLGDMLFTPTLVAAPVATFVTVLVSRRTDPPSDLDRLWSRMHGTAGDRQAERLARLTITGLTGPDRPGRGVRPARGVRPGDRSGNGPGGRFSGRSGGGFGGGFGGRFRGRRR